MTRKKTAEPETPEQLPQSGGAWVRQPDGSLIRDPGEAQAEPAGHEAPLRLPPLTGDAGDTQETE